MRTMIAAIALATGALIACSEPVGPSRRSPLLQGKVEWGLSSTIAFTSTRDDPTNPTPSLAAEIYLMNGAGRTNLTKSPEAIDDDPDWSPDGAKIVFTSHAVTDNQLNSITAEIYVINADGTGEPVRLTNNAEEERAPAWSPDGTHIVFMCRRGGSDFEICVTKADGTEQVQLTDNTVLDATPTWSPDGGQIVFHRPVAGRFQLWLMNADGTGQVQLTDTPGLNLFANWGEVRVRTKREPEEHGPWRGLPPPAPWKATP